MGVRVETREGPEGLDREPGGWTEIAPLERRLAALANRVIDTAGQDAGQPAVAPEQAADRTGHGPDEMLVGDGLEHLIDDLLGEERGALCLARGADVAARTGEREQVLGAAALSADACEASLDATAVEEALDRQPDADQASH